MRSLTLLVVSLVLFAAAFAQSNSSTPTPQSGLIKNLTPAKKKVVIPGTDEKAIDQIFEGFADHRAVQRETWFSDGEFPLIIDSLRLTVDLEPWNYEDYTNLGWMYGNLERKDLELATYITFRNLNPDDFDASYPEAQFYFFRQQSVRVISLLAPAILQNQKPHPNTYRLLAHSYRRMGLLRDSLRVWDELIKLDPTDLQAKNQRNRMAEQLGLPRID